MVPGACGIRTVWRHVRTALFASAGGPALSAVAAGIWRDGRFPGQHRDLRAPLRAALRPQPPPRALTPAEEIWWHRLEPVALLCMVVNSHRLKPVLPRAVGSVWHRLQPVCLLRPQPLPRILALRKRFGGTGFSLCAFWAHSHRHAH